MKRSIRLLLAAPVVLAFAAACSGKDDAAADAALQKDIALASQMSPYQPQQFVSGQELGYGPNGQPMYAPYPAPYGYPQPYPPQYYPQPYGYPAPAPVYQQQATVRPVSTARRTTSSSSSSGRSSGTVAAPARREPTVIRNTKRDAAIGAVAGGILGAATSRDKVKGAIIGAAAGGVLGGIIGHTVDVKRVP